MLARVGRFNSRRLLYGLPRAAAWLCTTNQAPVRVRFAPSPTGYLHLGGLRTALFNYLFAKRYGGEFVLRIEDTDRTRLVEDSVDQIVESLKWAGISAENMPTAEEPAKTPVRQSERLDNYKAAADRLMDEGHAYRCFCSSERLAALRESQAAAGLPTVYDRTCASLPKADADARAAAGEPHVVRMRVPSGSSVVRDAVLGEVTFPHAAIDDQVLLKSDGWPTYHLACVVDDADMGISHVIRGQEWLSSTPKHQLLHAALGSACPHWVHLPLLVNPDRTKLSKRQGHVSVGDFKAAGASPEALVNFVALLGWHPGGGDTTEVMDLQQLQEAFATEGLNKANCVVDRSKLAWFNAQHLRRHVARSPVSLRDMLQWMHGRSEAPAAAVSCTPFAIAATTALPAIAAQVETNLGDGVASGLSPWAEAETPTMRAAHADALPQLAADGALHPEHWVSSGAGWAVRWGVLHAALLLQHERVGMYPDYAALCWPLFARPHAQHDAVRSALPAGSAESLPAVAAELSQRWRELPAAAWGEAGVPQVMAAFKATCSSTGQKMGMVMKPARVLLTAADRGVAMNDLLAFLGQDEAALRVSSACR